MIFAEGESFSPTDKSFTSSSRGGVQRLRRYVVFDERYAAAAWLNLCPLLPRYFIILSYHSPRFWFVLDEKAKQNRLRVRLASISSP